MLTQKTILPRFFEIRGGVLLNEKSKNKKYNYFDGIMGGILRD